MPDTGAVTRFHVCQLRGIPFICAFPDGGAVEIDLLIPRPFREIFMRCRAVEHTEAQFTDQHHVAAVRVERAAVKFHVKAVFPAAAAAMRFKKVDFPVPGRPLRK